MPIISTIGRGSAKVRLLIVTIYALLIGGAVTMTYPFLLMIAGSTKSTTDKSEMRVIPGYLTSEEVLWAKHVEGLFNESLEMMRQVHGSGAAAFEQVTPPANPNRAMADAWRAFLEASELPHYTYTIGYLECPVSRGVIPRALRDFKGQFIERFDGDIQRCNRALGTDFPGWNSFFVLAERYLVQRDKPLETPMGLELRKFKAAQPLANRYYFTVEGFYRVQFLQTQYTRDIRVYNGQHDTRYASHDQVHLTRRMPAPPDARQRRYANWRQLGRRARRLLRIPIGDWPDRSWEPAGLGQFLRDLRTAWRPARRGWPAQIRQTREDLREFGRAGLNLLGLRDDPWPGRTGKAREDWEEFVRTIVNLFWIRADEEAAPLYRRFLRAKYGDPNALSERYGRRYASFDDVPLIAEPPAGGLPLSDWDAFRQGWKDPDTGEMHILPAEMIRVHSVDFLFRDDLKRRYGDLGRLNQAMGTNFSGWLDVLPPQRDFHYLAFRQQTGELRREFSVRNYLAVFDYMVLHGRGILNTGIYCALAVIAALLVNPLAAYALSRYRPPSAYKVLLFLMLTMAFPPMVAQIPVFLMLREFNLLNTFWALILPGLANGYSIFLLKGFFDSQPRELYESAALDGAGEFRIFWQITMSLSKPILAVIALGAFTMAYSNFMFALLICQDNKMWTLMVWLYELQQRSSQGVIYASLLIAAIPVFLVFALCQKVIMRGIVVPVEK